MKNRIERLQKNKYYKNLLSLYREYETYRDLAYEPETVVELKKPLKVGYVRTYKVREDILKTKEGKFIKEALDVCNVQQFSHTRNFDKIDFVPRYISSITRLNPFKFDLAIIREDVYNELSMNAKHYFLEVRDYHPYAKCKYYKPSRIYYDWLSIKIKPHYVYSYSVFNNEAISKRDRIDNYLKKNDLYHKIYKMKYGSACTDNFYKYRKKEDKHKERKKMNQEIRKLY